MKKYFSILLVLMAGMLFTCTSSKKETSKNADLAFANFENRFLDSFWKENPSSAILVGYGKYYEGLVIPDSAAVAKNTTFFKRWLDSLEKMDLTQLNDNNKISFDIIKNQLESNIWYNTIFKPQEWDASSYNLSGECDKILTENYAPLNERLIILGKHLEHADDYYRAAFAALKNPTREHVEMAISQSQGGLTVFGKSLTDSIKASTLTDAQVQQLLQTIGKTTSAINKYTDNLKAILADKNYKFRSFRIGKDLYTDKFRYDLATDFAPEQLYERAMADKKTYQRKMTSLAVGLWSKYFGTKVKPSDSLQIVQLVMEKIALQHATPKDFFDSLTNHVYRLKKFIVEKDLFNFDSNITPIKVRMMPEYARGFSVANAEFTPPYQKQGTTYYNIDDLTAFSSEKSEGTLREYNNYSAQILSIHEAVPGHCFQSIYNQKNSPDVIRAVFTNGAMVEGWAVYTEDMMYESGWGAFEPEMELTLYKWKLRELSNVLIDYDIQCLDKPKESIVGFLTRECFQTEAQAEEKYHRATLSQVQLCSYYAGAAAIHTLRNDYKSKMGSQFNLKKFHEQFLSFGSSPVKYIRERMLE